MTDVFLMSLWGSWRGITNFENSNIRGRFHHFETRLMFEASFQRMSKMQKKKKKWEESLSTPRTNSAWTTLCITKTNSMSTTYYAIIRCPKTRCWVGGGSPSVGLIQKPVTRLTVVDVLDNFSLKHFWFSIAQVAAAALWWPFKLHNAVLADNSRLIVEYLAWWSVNRTIGDPREWPQFCAVHHHTAICTGKVSGPSSRVRSFLFCASNMEKRRLWHE